MLIYTHTSTYSRHPLLPFPSHSGRPSRHLKPGDEAFLHHCQWQPARAVGSGGDQTNVRTGFPGQQRRVQQRILGIVVVAGRWLLGRHRHSSRPRRGSLCHRCQIAPTQAGQCRHPKGRDRHGNRTGFQHGQPHLLTDGSHSPTIGHRSHPRDCGARSCIAQAGVGPSIE